MVKKEYSTWSKTELIREVKKIEKRKKYGIVWEDKPEKVAKLCEEKLPTLEEDTKKEVKTNEKKPVNILIEGDNYHALSVLNYTHKGKIDVIYIDPPYNTRNGDGFRYNDKIVDKEDGYRHSKWVSFMEKRLRLAKNLMSRKGVLFVSIDNNEFAQLKLLCDEIFNGNFIGCFVWRKKAGAGADSKLIFSQHEYILFYAKNIKNLDKFFQPLTEKQKKEYKNPDNDSRGAWAPTDLTAPSSDTDDSRLYDIVSPSNKKWLKRWSYTKANMNNLIKDNLVWFGKDGNSMPKRKRFLSEKQGLVPRSWINFVLTSDGKKDFEKIFGKDNKLFEYPKPISLIKHFIKIASSNKSIILDFFAGTGTTGQSVLELNNEDSSNRRFILCTNNENKICTDVCYPRIKKVIQNLEREPKGKLISNKPGRLKYFKTNFVDAEPTDRNKKKLVNKSTEMLCLKEYCFDEVKKAKDFTIFKNSQDKYLGIIYDDSGIVPFKKEVKKLKKKFVVYVFSLDESAREEEFEDVTEMVKLRPIPAVILNVYKRIFK